MSDQSITAMTIIVSENIYCLLVVILMPALIDVLIPVYNGERYVRQALKSIQHQTIKDIRIIVVDDGSTDGTAKILSELSQADDRIEVIHKPNSGIVDALNLGLADCKAEFVARHDADDNADPTRFEIQLQYLRAHLDCAAVAGAVRYIDETGRPTGGIGSPPQPERADPTAAPCLEPYLIHPFLMVRRAIIQGVGGYRHVYHAEDTDLYWRIQEIAVMRNLSDVLGEYRLHGGSVTSHSIENGRVAALSAQLSAISAVRRRSNRPDLTFPRDAIEAYKVRGKDLQAMYDYACGHLTADEAAYLKVAIAAKLIEVAGFRPYELTLEDCQFIKAALVGGMMKLSPANRRQLRKQCSGTVARLAYKGKINEAHALIWPALIAPALYRFIMRILVPPSLRRAIKEMTLPLVQAARRRSYVSKAGV